MGRFYISSSTSSPIILKKKKNQPVLFWRKIPFAIEIEQIDTLNGWFLPNKNDTWTPMILSKSSYRMSLLAEGKENQLKVWKLGTALGTLVIFSPVT